MSNCLATAVVAAAATFRRRSATACSLRKTTPKSAEQADRVWVFGFRVEGFRGSS